MKEISHQSHEIQSLTLPKFQSVDDFLSYPLSDWQDGTSTVKCADLTAYYIFKQLTARDYLVLESGEILRFAISRPALIADGDLFVFALKSSATMAILTPSESAYKVVGYSATDEFNGMKTEEVEGILFSGQHIVQQLDLV